MKIYSQRKVSLELRRHFNLENGFALMVIVFGIIFAVFTPPNEIPDESMHFVRAYGIITGNFVSPKITIPTSYKTMLNNYHYREPGKSIDFKSYFAEFTDKDSQAGTVELPASNYSPVLYLPQIIGLGLGMALKLNTRWVFLLGRIASVIIYVIASYFILKTTPVSKRSLFVLFAMPMSVYLTASYSADVVQNVLCFFYLHLVVTGIKSPNTITKTERASFLLISTLLALAKPVSVLLPLLSFAIPINRFGSKRERLLFIASQFVVILTITSIWGALTTSALRHPPNVDPVKQLVFIIINPLATMKMITTTVSHYADFYFKSFVGWFGWLTTPLPDFVYFLFIVGLALAILGDMKDNFTLTRRQKIIFLSVFLLYVVSLIIIMYISWTAVGNTIAEGVQGRYFVSIFPLALYLTASFRRPELGKLDRILTGTISVSVLFFLVISVQTIYLKYFVTCGEEYYSITNDTCIRPLGLQTDNPEMTVGKLDRPFTQTFIAECNNLSEIAFFLSAYSGNKKGYLDVKLRDLTTDTVAFKTDTFVHQTTGEWKEFSFPPLPDSKSHQYSLSIAPQKDPINAASLGVIASDIYPQGELVGTDIPGDLVFKYTCRTGFLYDLRRIKR